MNFFLFFFLFYRILSQSSFDLYIDYFSQCSPLCTGLEESPFPTISKALSTIYAQFKLIKPNSNTTINIRFLNSVYISTKNETNNLFSSWESNLKVNFTVNMMPNACYFTENCSNFLFFMLKNETIAFYTTFSFMVKNIVFDAKDANLLDSSAFLQATCYNTSRGCCNKELFLNETSDCFLANRSLTRNSNNNDLGLFQIKLTTGSFVIENCVFRNFLSQKASNYYGFLFSPGKNDKPSDNNKGGGTSTYLNLSVSIKNATFSNVYFSSYLLNSNRANITIYLEKVNVLHYNPYFFYETSTDSKTIISLLSSTGTKNTKIMVNSSTFLEVQNVVNAASLVIFTNCSFSLKTQNISNFAKPPNGPFRVSSGSNLTIISCNFSYNFSYLEGQITDRTMNEISVFSINSLSFLTINDSIFEEMKLFEAELIYANTYNTILLNKVKFKGISHVCSDLPSVCDFTLLSFYNYNNISILNCEFNGFLWSFDKGFLLLDSFNRISIINTTFANFTSVSNTISMITSTSYNRFSFRNCTFTDYFIDSGYYFIVSGLFDVISITNSHFSSQFYDKTSSFASLLNSVSLMLSNCKFMNISYNSPIFWLYHNTTITVNNCSFFDLFFTENGLFYLYEKNSSIRINSTIFSNISAFSQGGVLFLANLNKASVNNSVFVQCSSRNQDGGVFFLNNYNNLTVESSVFKEDYAYYGGVLSAYYGNTLFFTNSSFFDTESENNGGAFYLINSNVFVMKKGEIQGGGSLSGKGGFIILIINNQFNLKDFMVKNVFGYGEGGFLYGETGNSINVSTVFMRNISSQADGGCFFFKEANFFLLDTCDFINISSSLSGGFLNIKKYNEIRINSSSFVSVISSKEGGFGYLESMNNLTINSNSFYRVIGYTGGLFATSNLNNLTINYDTFIDISSFSTAGGFWCFSSNSIMTDSSNFVNLRSYGAGGGFFLSQSNKLLITNCSFKNVECDDSGGLLSVEIGNEITVEYCELLNFTVMVNGLLAFAKFENSITFTANNISFFYYLGLFYMNSENFLMFSINKIEVFYAKFNPTLLFANFSNSLIFENSVFLLKNTVIPVKFMVFSLLSHNNLSLFNNNFFIDLCYSFLEAYEQSQISIENMNFKGFSTVNTKLIYLENSNLLAKGIFFKENRLKNSIEAVNSQIKLVKFAYFPFQNSEIFIESVNCSIALYHSYYYNSKGKNTFSQMIKGEKIQLLLLDVSILMAFSAEIPFIELLDSKILIRNCFFAFNEASDKGGVMNSIRKEESIVEQIFHVKKTIFLKNQAKNLGGCVFMEIFTNSTYNHVHFERNHFFFNKAFRGGIFAGKRLSYIELYKNKFLKNEGISRFSQEKAKGGGFYLYNSLEADQSIDFNVTSNVFLLNKAEIGGIFYIEGMNFSFFSLIHNKFFRNKADFYGNEFASETYRIRFFSLEKALDSSPRLSADLYRNARISRIKSGQNYQYCLLKINGYDRFGSITYNTDENFMDKMNISSQSLTKITNEFTPVSEAGFLCFKGIFQRKELPLAISLDYTILSSFPSSRIHFFEKKLQIQLQFSSCEIGERMTENFQCIPC